MKKIFLFMLLLAAPLSAANNGTIVGTPTFGAAKFSNGLITSGPSDYITLPSAVLSLLGSTPTYNVWVRASPSGFINFVVLGTNDYIGVNGSGFLFFAGFGHTAFTVTGTNIDDSLLHHIEVTYTGTAVKVFVDGTQILTDTVAYAAPDGVGFKIGNNGAVTGTVLAYMVDELAFWNTSLHSTTFTPPSAAYTGSETNLKALYHLQADGTDSVASAGSLSAISPTTIVGSSTGNVITLTGTTTAWTAGTPGTPTFTIGAGCTKTAQSVASATSGTITVTAPGSAGSCVITDPSTGTTQTLTISAAPTLTSVPTAIAVSTTGNTLNFTGTLTAWTPGTPGSPVITVSGGCTITAQTVASTTAAVLTVSSGGAATTCVFTDPSTSTTLSVPVIASGGGAATISFR